MAVENLGYKRASRKHGRQVRAGLDRWTDCYLHTVLGSGGHRKVLHESSYSILNSVVACTLCFNTYHFAPILYGI